MDTHIPVLILCLTGLAAVSIVSWTALKAWRDWLSLKEMALKAGTESGPSSSAASPTARIELAALRDRVRKLEAIASGVDLLP